MLVPLYRTYPLNFCPIFSIKKNAAYLQVNMIGDLQNFVNCFIIKFLIFYHIYIIQVTK